VKVPLPQSNKGRGLASWVTESLREAILQGHFDPGEKLDQNRLASELNVSRTPIREALKVLESEGFIEIHSYRGAFIAKVSQQDINNVYEIRRLLEVEVARQVPLIIPDATIAELERLLTADQQAFDNGENAKHFEYDSIFHDTFMKYTHNMLVREVLDNLNNRVIRVRYFALNQPGEHLRESLKEHWDILQGLKKRDPDLTAEKMRVHLTNSAARIKELLL
jgi:DNA-binding GntR family transcriptional regulator